MAAGLGVLVAFAAVPGLGFGPLERLLGTEMAEAGLLAPVLGLMAALSGLAPGFLVAPVRLLGPLTGLAQNGFAVFGGRDALVLRPVLAIAAACERLERRLCKTVQGIRRINLLLGGIVRRADNDGIDGAIFCLVRQTIRTGTRARKLQSGFIHREMALSVIGMAVIFAALLAAPR